MAARFYSVVIDSAEPTKLAEWWAEAIGWKVGYAATDEVVLVREDEMYPELVFVRVLDPKRTKNRLHIDLAPDDQSAEVARLTSLGATPVDVGQASDNSWVVLADPEGNEFCVLSARDGGM